MWTSEFAWAAGLFEGEGAVTECSGRYRLSLKMVEEASVRRFRDAVGGGKVYGPYGPYPSAHAKRPFWMWVAETDDAVRIGRELQPLLSDWRAEKLIT